MSSDSEWEFIPPKTRASRPPPKLPAPSRAKVQWTPLEGAKDDGGSTNAKCSVSLATETLIRDLLAKPAVSVVRRPAVPVVTQEEEFSDKRMRQNLAIVCRRYRREFGLLPTQLGTLDEAISAETAEAALAAVRKIPSDQIDFLGRAKSEKLAAEPERVLRELVLVDRVCLRLEFVIVRTEMPLRVAQFRMRIAGLEGALVKIKSSTQLDILLSLARKLGNLINGETVNRISVDSIFSFKLLKLPTSGKRVSAFDLLVQELKTNPQFDLRAFNAQLDFGQVDFASLPDEKREFGRWLEAGVQVCRQLGQTELQQTLEQTRLLLVGEFNEVDLPALIAQFGGSVSRPEELVTTVASLRKEIMAASSVK